MKNLLLLLLLCLSGSFVSEAQIQGLDPTFATNGIYVGDTGGFAKVVIQPDKKAIITGQEIKNGSYTNVIRRFNEDGTLDYSFAINGCFKPSILGFYQANAMAVCLQNDGKILLAGSADTGITSGDFFLIRLKSDGSFDSSFGGSGYVMSSYIHPFSPSIPERILSIALQPDGKILAYGYFHFVSDTLLVRRYHPNGRIDSSFGANGQAKLIQGFDYPKPNDIATTSDDRIVVGATSKINVLGTYAFTAIRLLSDGSLDTSFNHTGIAYASLPGINYCKAMCVQPDNKVVLAGYADSMAVIRFDTSGKLDNSFGMAGIAKISYGDARGMTFQPDHKIIISGKNDTSAAIYRLLPNGGIDNGFGINGHISTNLLTAYSSVAVQADNKLVGCGYVLYSQGSSTYSKTVMTRFTPNATSIKDTAFNTSIQIYPNPANDQITIGNKTGKPIRYITLYSPEGKLILQRTYPHTDRLSTDGLSNGMYLLRVDLDNQPAITRILLIQKN